jgi:N,N'-diacetyllegionaminate synthase
MNSSFIIENHTISRNSPPFLVAEIGLNHNNNEEIGKKTIQEAKKAGVHAVKFQSYITEEFIDPKNSEAKFLFDIFKQYELSESLHKKFQQTAADEGLVFFSTPLCESSVDLLVSLKVPVLKIASGDIVNFSLIKKCNSTGLPIFLSTGAADFFEVTRAIDFLKNNHTKNLCLMHCVSLYPTPLNKLNLNVISTYKNLYDIPIGFSDHSAGITAGIVSVSLGATVIEKHFTLDKTLPGPDHTISINPEEMNYFSAELQYAYTTLGESNKFAQPEEINGRYYGRRSTYSSDHKILALRPALHIKDDSILDSWEIEKILEKNINFSDGPIRLNSKP